MNKKWILDWSVICVSLAAAWLAWFYTEAPLRIWLTVGGCLLALVFFFISLSDRGGAAMELDTVPEGGGVTQLVLLSEEDTELASWDLYGKTALVIGRDMGENQVDVNLGAVTYASMIDVEHATLNYAAGYWYVEDLGSKNGVSVQPASDGKKYRLAADRPCKLHRGDFLFVGLTKLVIR